MIVSVTCIIIRGAANTRYFLFPVANFPFRLQFFLQSFDELLEFIETWGFRDFICPLASLEIDLNIYMQRWCAFKA